MLVFWLMIGWMWCWLCEFLWLIVFILLFMLILVDLQNDFYVLVIVIIVLDVVFKVGNNVWCVVFDLVLVVLFGFGLYLLIVVICWLLEWVWKNCWYLLQDVEDELILWQMMQFELMLDVDICIDEYGDWCMCIELCLQFFVMKFIFVLCLVGVQYEVRFMLGFFMDCVFCVIVGGCELVYRFFEDEYFIVLLDIFLL